MTRILLLAAVALSLTACTRNCVSAVSLDAAGELVFTPICPRLGPPASATSIAGPHMAAPAPGAEWWNIGR